MCSRSCRERRAVGREHRPEELQCVTVQGAFSAPLVVLSCSAAHGLGNQC